jgi:hypothetical protein
MTKPSTRDPLYLTEGQVAARFEISAAEWKGIAAALEKTGLPMRDPVFGNRRYWPAIMEFLDRRAGMGKDEAAAATADEDADADEGSRSQHRKTAKVGSQARQPEATNGAGRYTHDDRRGAARAWKARLDRRGTRPD